MATVRYFYCADVNPGVQRVRLAGPELHHLVRVSRVRQGERVMLLDGRGGVYEAVMARTGQGYADLDIVSHRQSASPPAIDIALTLVKVQRFDMAVEKCAELGVRTIIPVASERSLWRGGGREAEKRRERICNKVIAACKQAGQSHFPRIATVATFEMLLDALPTYGAVYLADQRGAQLPDRAAATSGAAGLGSGLLGIVGPEGGLSPRERQSLLDHGAVAVSLGPNRLRTETAAICLLFWLHRCAEAGSPGM